ncbi:TPA: hypothetical protein EYP38_03560 [Candidatus Micrarchaeota archaeon]|nr:hypothetical protein [Candidatus Micrarchaeota archaeon]
MASKKPVKKKRPAPRRRPAAKPSRPARSSSKCFCGSECNMQHARLPGYLLIALGIMAVPLNFGFLPMMDWAKAWPLLLVLFGFVLVIRTTLCRRF